MGPFEQRTDDGADAWPDRSTGDEPVSDAPVPPIATPGAGPAPSPWAPPSSGPAPFAPATPRSDVAAGPAAAADPWTIPVAPPSPADPAAIWGPSAGPPGGAAAPPWVPPTLAGSPVTSPTGSSWPTDRVPAGWQPSTGLDGFPSAPPMRDEGVGRAPDAEPGKRGPSTTRVAVIAAVVGALVAGLLTGAAFLLLDDDQVASGTARQLSGEGLDIRSLLDRAQPSVVSISTGQETTRGVFGGAGSGVIISDDGLVLTNAHVIAGATTMDVTMSDGDVRTATLVGSSPDDDIALVRIDDPSGLVPAELGSSGGVQVGDDVVAIGNALNLGGPPSVTQGIVSAKDRTISAPGELVLRNLIQTDAAINPGNSGGPLLDADGRVVGINTAIIDDAQNIGFAIAIDPIKPLIDDLAAGNGTITPDSAFLGVSMMDLGEVLASVREEYGVTAEEGAFVSDLVPDSAADVAGLELGDVIVAIDGEPVTDPDDAAEIIRSHEPGEDITITYERAGEQADAVAELRSRADGGG